MHRTVRRQKSRGQAIVEFALILPVFLLLTVGIVDMARIFTAYVALTNGVSSAALYASQGGFTHWCSGGGADVTCPGPGHAFANPDNIAYQIQVEAAGMTLGDIDLSVPQCTPVGSPEPPAVDCTSITPHAYSKVKIVASYHVGLITPVISAILGGQVNMTAATTAAIY